MSVATRITVVREVPKAPVLPVASPTVVNFGEVATRFGKIKVFTTERGLLKLALPNETRAHAEAYVSRVLGPVEFREENSGVMREVLDQLGAYFAGAARDFSLPLDPRGTEFQRRVWDAVAKVPYGATCSYADIARAIGKPAAVRAVGAANGSNPLPIVVPCHRIIGADSSLTGYGGGLEMKQGLLALERGAGNV